FLAHPRDQFLSIVECTIDREGRRNLRGIVQQMRFSGRPLVPVHNREVLLPAATEVPTHGHGDVAGSAVEEDQHRIPRVVAANRHPLLDPADHHLLEPLDAMRRHNSSRLCDDRDSLGAIGGFDRYLSWGAGGGERHPDQSMKMWLHWVSESGVLGRGTGSWGGCGIAACHHGGTSKAEPWCRTPGSNSSVFIRVDPRLFNRLARDLLFRGVLPPRVDSPAPLRL